MVEEGYGSINATRNGEGVIWEETWEPKWIRLEAVRSEDYDNY